MAEQTRVRVEDFDIREFIRNPFNIRRIADCPKCGQKKTERCRLPEAEHKPEMYVHAERKHEAIRVIQADIERLKAVEARHQAGYDRHDRMVAAGKMLASIGCTRDISPAYAVKMYHYAYQRGEVDEFTDLEVRAGQAYRIKNF